MSALSFSFGFHSSQQDKVHKQKKKQNKTKQNKHDIQLVNYTVQEISYREGIYIRTFHLTWK